MLIIGFQMIVNFADECGKLPDIPNLGTETKFPVSYNTPVTVKCSSGYSLEGSDVITCIKGENYRSIDGHLPSCRESKWFTSEQLQTHISNS